ncbi:16S rRNA (uracil(1498)-N(3))-methyltransferase [Lujinxingia sediminis]|uniref:Ribosomal RNA small subunit methyltransferase E n=1 Tax=Lujinxingia sediminis TaxID=2480984 RepID=A0ABY0CTW1_9DELT|nr:16S rRNA (uracil(1498)-N(3))-methyltransferase [Lujinxingia sediminis]RVU44743.1 16S rRNA (uracil(1498)-N(3))-methyltransferase [Lujinxingia sediminis]
MRRVPLTPEIFDFLSDAAHRERFVLPEQASHYVRTVLRLPPGAPVELFDGSGRLARATLVECDADQVIAQVDAPRISERGESSVQWVLFQAIPKGDRWEWLLEKATELGVDAIVPLATRRGVVQLSDDRFEKKRARWEKIIAGAARQCRRAKIPSLHAPLPPERALESHPCDTHLVAHLGHGMTAVHDALERRASEGDAIARAGLWVGPEGGFEEAEVDAILNAGGAPITLGPRVLRAETAGLTLLTLAQNALGEL